MSLQSYLLHQAKFDEHGRRRESSVASKVSNECENESQLHEDIIEYCKSKGWYYVHSRMDQRSTNAIGTPDFIIAIDGGKTLWIECKIPGKKATIFQLAALTHLNKLQHKARLVTSMDGFVEAVKQAATVSA